MKQHLIVLDGMRGVAALAVGMLHARQLLVNQSEGFKHAYLAVDFFFCLSGFVIAYAYSDRLNSSLSFKQFVRLRLIRLYPILFLGALLGSAVYMLGSKSDTSVSAILCIGSFLLLPTGLIFQRNAYPVNDPIWSLFFELVANFIYAALNIVPLWGIYVVMFLSGIALTAVSYINNGLGLIGFYDTANFMMGFIRIFFPFVAGVFIFRLNLSGRFQTAAAFPIILLMIILAVPATYKGLYDPFAVIFVIPLIIVLGINAQIKFGTKILIFLGRISFPFYIFHQPIIRVIKNIPSISKPLSKIDYLLPLSAVGVAVIASYIVVVFIDEPVRKILSDRFNTKEKSQDLVRS